MKIKKMSEFFAISKIFFRISYVEGGCYNRLKFLVKIEISEIGPFPIQLLSESKEFFFN